MDEMERERQNRKWYLGDQRMVSWELMLDVAILLLTVSSILEDPRCPEMVGEKDLRQSEG